MFSSLPFGVPKVYHPEEPLQKMRSEVAGEDAPLMRVFTFARLPVEIKLVA